MVSALEKCIQDGGSLNELWSVGNQHGPVRSIVGGALVVLGSQDGSVKQWTVDGDEPSYGRPFTMQGQAVPAMAMSAEHILAATEDGMIAEWKLSDAKLVRTTMIPNEELTALAVSPDAAHVVAGTATGKLVSVERASATKTDLVGTMWGVRTIAYAAGNRLFTAGHWYGNPQVERRAADSPIDAPDMWRDTQRTGHVTAVAMDRDGKRLIAASPGADGGKGFVATFLPDYVAAGPVSVTEHMGHDVVGGLLLPGGALFVTAGKEGTLKVWNAETTEPVASLTIPSPVGIATDTEGTRLYTSGPDGRLHAFGCK
jgi:WD40 repeat protein